jgi:hypothetical protein
VREAQTWAFGFILFAAFMLIVVGAFQVMYGIAAIFEDEFFVLTRNYLYDVDVTVWGWIHLIWGIVLIAAGIGLFTGKAWAVVVGIVVAAISAIQNFISIPYYPVWSLLIIALDIIVIWALAAHGRDLREMTS